MTKERFEKVTSEVDWDLAKQSVKICDLHWMKSKVKTTYGVAVTQIYHQLMLDKYATDLTEDMSEGTTWKPVKKPAIQVEELSN